MEQSPDVDPISHTMEEPLAARPTSPGGRAHNEGDPADMPGYEEAWTKVEALAGLAGAGTKTTRNALSSAARDPLMVVEQATPTTTPVTRIGLRHPI